MSLRKHDLQRRQSEYSLRSSYLKPVFCVVCYRPIDALSSPYDPGCGHIGHEECFKQKANCPKCLGPVNMTMNQAKKSENKLQKLFTTARQKSMFFRNSTIPLEQFHVHKSSQNEFSSRKILDIPSHPAIFGVDFEILTDYDVLKKSEGEVIMYINVLSQYQDMIDLPQIYSLDVAVCLDMSESMAHGNKLNVAREITSTLLYDLQSTDRMCILTTLPDDKNKIFALHTCDNLHKAAVQTNLGERLKDMKGIHSCYSDDGINKALDILIKNKRHGRLGHIIVISDGYEVSISSDKINQISSQAKRNNIPIHSFGVGPCPDPTYLRHLSNLGAEGGCYICVDEIRKVKNFLRLCAAGSCMASLSNIKINVTGLEGVSICDMKGDKNVYYDAESVYKHDNKLELIIGNLTPLEERSFFITLNVPSVSSFSNGEPFVVSTEALASELENMIKTFPANIASCKVSYNHPCFPNSTILRLNTKYATIKRLDHSEDCEDISSAKNRNPTVLLALLRQYALEGMIHAHEMVNRGRVKAAVSLINVALGKIEEVIDEIWRPDEIQELKDELRFQRSRIHSRTISVTPRRAYTCMSAPIVQERCFKVQPLRTPKISPNRSISKQLWKSPSKIHDSTLHEATLDDPSPPFDETNVLKDRMVNTLLNTQPSSPSEQAESIFHNKNHSMVSEETNDLETKVRQQLSLARTRSQITKTTTTIEYSANLSHLKEGRLGRRRSLDPVVLRKSSRLSTSSITLPCQGKAVNPFTHVHSSINNNNNHNNNNPIMTHRRKSSQTEDEAKRIWRELRREMRTPRR